MNPACPKCGSEETECIGWYAIRISLDDAVDISQFICKSCNHEWEW